MKLCKALTVALTFSALALMTGCAKTTEPDTFDYKDGNAGFVVSEEAGMDDAVFAAVTALPRAFVADADTYYVERTIDPLHYDADIQGFVRHATIIFPEGRRERRDTVYFLDAGGSRLSAPTIATVDSVHHKRTTVRSREGNVVEISLEMFNKLTTSATDTLITKNGTISGSFNGYEFRNTTVTNVVRHRVDGHWGLPQSGNIYIDRILRTIEIVFTGNNTATCTITRKRDNKIWVILVDLVTARETDK